jgi:hypothetical protein
MPAFVNRRLGESGIKLDEGTIVCPFDLKKSRNDWRICELVINRVGEDKKTGAARRAEVLNGGVPLAHTPCTSQVIEESKNCERG